MDLTKQVGNSLTNYLILYNNNPLKQKVMIEVKENSNIGKILNGKTRGYHSWYVKKILETRFMYKIKKEN